MICAWCMAKFVKGDFFIPMEAAWFHNECAQNLIYEAMACSGMSLPDITLFINRSPNAFGRIWAFAYAYFKVKIARGEFNL